ESRVTPRAAALARPALPGATLPAFPSFPSSLPVPGSAAGGRPEPVTTNEGFLPPRPVLSATLGVPSGNFSTTAPSKARDPGAAIRAAFARMAPSETYDYEAISRPVTPEASNAEADTAEVAEASNTEADTAEVAEATNTEADTAEVAEVATAEVAEVATEGALPDSVTITEPTNSPGPGIGPPEMTSSGSVVEEEEEPPAATEITAEGCALHVPHTEIAAEGYALHILCPLSEPTVPAEIPSEIAEVTADSGIPLEEAPESFVNHFSPFELPELAAESSPFSPFELPELAAESPPELEAAAQDAHLVNST
ncbi:unnamed protein product, partial [Polarella glacialis]